MRSGDDCSSARKKPQINPLSPIGRNDLGSTRKKTIVPIRQTIHVTADIHLRSRNHDSERPYLSSNQCSTPPITRCIHVSFVPFPRPRRILEHISGVSVSDTRPDAIIATMIVIENSLNILPTSPDMNTSGINTAASEIVIDRIVKLISAAL